jgi:hypothetical protein
MFLPETVSAAPQPDDTNLENRPSTSVYRFTQKRPVKPLHLLEESLKASGDFGERFI